MLDNVLSEYFSNGFARLIKIDSTNLLDDARADIEKFVDSQQIPKKNNKGNLHNESILIKDNLYFGKNKKEEWELYKIDEAIRTVNSFALKTLQDILSNLLAKKINAKYYNNQIVIKKNLISDVLPFHRDSKPNKNKFLNIGLYFDLSNEENGGVYFVPRSHLEVDLKSNFEANGCTHEENEKYKNLKQGVLVSAEKGEVLLHDSYCIHGSSSNFSQQTKRITFYTKYIIDEK
jgi:ectoine hydroxylase-related dioxygenase (phytanoyl-CoA dioxygenase family)